MNERLLVSAVFVTVALLFAGIGEMFMVVFFIMMAIAWLVRA